MTRTLTCLLGALLLATAGCADRCSMRRHAVPPPPVRAIAVPAAPCPVAPPAGVPAGAVIPPPAGLPGAAGPIPTAPPGPAPVAPPPGPSRVEFRWTPVVPDPTKAGDAPKAPDKGARVLLFPPEEDDPLLGSSKSEPTKTELKKPSTSLPVGIANFAMPRDQVASGLRPSLDDGLDWLAANGYKTVLFVRSPGELDNADRRQVEKRGMRFISLEVNPEDLRKETADEFMRVVRDKTGQPLFVYDRDGSLAGGMWYLDFRLGDLAAEDVARIRAGGLGLTERGAMWDAVRRLAP